MKLIIFGSTGMLGRYVSVYLSRYYETSQINRSEFDATKPHNLLSLLEKYGRKNEEYVYVINCIGIIPQQGATDPNIYKKVNTEFPLLLAQHCQDLGYRLIHITTDCVYSGSRGNYDEDSAHDETSVYGVSKSRGEPKNCCVIRTSIIGEELRNKKSLLEWVRAQEKINGYTDHFWNGVTCLQLAKIIYYIIAENKYWNYTRHIHSETVSKYELVKMIIETYNLKIRLIPFETEKVDKTLTSKYNFIAIPPLRQQLLEQKNFNLLCSE